MKSSRNNSLQRILALTFLSLLMFLGLKHANDEVIHTYVGVETVEWDAARVWIGAAECARSTGAWLTVCDNGKLFPIAQYALADDPGHAFLVGLMARLKRSDVTYADIARLNIFINLLGLLSVCALLYAVNCRIAAGVLLALGSASFFINVGVAPHAALIGVAFLAFIFPVTILLAAYGFLSSGFATFFLAFGIVCLSLVSLIREPIGTMGLVVSLGAIIYIYIFRLKFRYKLKFITLALCLFMVWQSPRWLILARDTFFPVEPATLIQTHGISHTLYLGLGAAGENKFGIRWVDGDGTSAVKNVDDNVVYVSPEYFRILWRLYFERVVQDPIEVTRIYALKLKKILSHRLPNWSPPLVLVLVAWCALIMIARKRRFWYNLPSDTTPIFSGVALIFVGLFVVQGVLAHPAKQYAFPITGFVLLFFSLVLQTYFNYGFRVQKDIEIKN